jgi:hypothetical protein
MADIETLNENLARKDHVRAECPSCGNVEWMTGENVVALSSGQVAGTGFEALVLVCSYCGFVRFHAASVLEPPSEAPPAVEGR